jgi:hypothetical protein
MNSAKPFMDINYTASLSVASYELNNVILYPNPRANAFSFFVISDKNTILAE